MHELSSVMTTLSLADRLSIELRKSICRDKAHLSADRDSDRPHWRVEADAPSVPSGENNICYRAAELFFEHLGIEPSSVCLSIFIEKNIPDAAGLGGGSADAAAVLRFLFLNRERLYRWFGREATSVSLDDLERIALRCGADVPFCLYGGTRFCEGVGEVMTPLPSLVPAAVLLATPAQSVRTKTAFQMLDRAGEHSDDGSRDNTPSRDAVALWEEVIARQSLEAVEPLVHNDFTPVISDALEKVRQLLDALRASRAPVVSMSGSGPTCFALFNNLDECESVFVSMASRFPDIRLLKTAIDSTPELL